MDLMDKLTILADAAKYDAACTSSGLDRAGPLSFSGLKKLGVVLKRAQYFITCSGRMLEGLRVREDGILSHLAALDRPALAQVQPEQLSLFEQTG